MSSAQSLSNLPILRTPLIGREEELATTRDLLLKEEVGLVTFTGPGGVGKTRLASQLAHSLLSKFPHGVYFVNLAPVSDPALVASTIAETLGVRESPNLTITESLKNYLRDRQMLLVLDNFEHVIDASSIVSELLLSSPGLKVLATSREVLHLYDEHSFPVPPLDLPGPEQLLGLKSSVSSLEQLTQYEAVRLFIRRAVAVKPDFQVTSDNAPAVAQICYRLDGLPLAIELAAARVRMLSPEAMLARLEHRLRLLTGGAKDLPVRHQTLHNTIEWSYNLLNEEEQRLFRRFAVFRGGCTLDAAEMVCNADKSLVLDTVDGVASLLDKSLLRQSDETAEEPRFTMLETIHEFAWEKLKESGEDAAIAGEHAVYYLRLAEDARPFLGRPQQRVWLDRLESEHNNFRTALRWALDSADLETAARLAGVLQTFWYMHSHLSEGRRWFREVLETSARTPLSVSLSAKAKALSGAASLTFLQGDHAEAQALAEESLRAYRSLGDKEGIAQATTRLGDAVYASGDMDRAALLFEEALALWRETAIPLGIAKALLDLGELARTKEDYATAQLRNEESLAIGREHGSLMGIVANLHNLGQIAHQLGDYSRAKACFTEGFLLSNELGNKLMSAWYVLGLAGLAASKRQPELSARLFGAGQYMHRSVGGGLDPADKRDYERSLADAREQLDQETFAKAWAEGEAMTADQIVDVVRSFSLEETGSDAQLPSSPSATKLRLGGLTRREQDVAVLIAEGKSNRKIADELVVGERTVEGHVSNILAKLGFQSRSQISAWVVERKLTKSPD